MTLQRLSDLQIGDRKVTLNHLSFYNPEKFQWKPLDDRGSHSLILGYGLVHDRETKNDSLRLIKVRCKAVLGWVDAAESFCPCIEIQEMKRGMNPYSP